MRDVVKRHCVSVPEEDREGLDGEDAYGDVYCEQYGEKLDRLERGREENKPMIQTSRKKGTNRMVRIVIMESIARPLEKKGLEYEGENNFGCRKTYTDNIPTQLSIQKMTKPPWPNLWEKRLKGCIEINSARD